MSRVGRPVVFTKANEVHAVAVVRKAGGYTRGRELLKAEGGVFATISVPTLMRFVARYNEKAKKPLVFKRGRPVAA